MNTRAHPRTTPPRQLWSATIWPQIAGAVAAVGVFAASSALGALAALMVYGTLSMLAVAVTWGLSLEIGIERGAALRCGLYASLVVLVALGLCQLHPVYGLLVGVAVGVTSPTALTLVATLRPQTRMERAERATRPAPGVLVDKAMLDRRFHDIVSQLTESRDFPES